MIDSTAKPRPRYVLTIICLWLVAGFAFGPRPSCSNTAQRSASLISGFGGAAKNGAGSMKGAGCGAGAGSKNGLFITIVSGGASIFTAVAALAIPGSGAGC